MGQRQAGRDAADLSVFRCQWARHRPPGSRDHGSPGEKFPARPRVSDQLRHDQVRKRKHRRSRAHVARGVPARPDRRFRVLARRAGDDHPDAGDTGRAGGDVCAHGGLRIFDQYAHAVRLDPGDRPGGRRRDHCRRKRREVSRARRSTVAGGAGGHGRDHRADRHDHAGAGGGIRAGRVHPRFDRAPL